MPSIILCTGPTQPGARSAVYLPFVATAPPEPVDQTAVFYDLLLHDGRQQRPQLERCKELDAAALWKAQDIAANNYWSHRAHNGEWPNATARRYCASLSPDYTGTWNGCESLVAGSDDAVVMFNALIGSVAHRAHILGETAFFRQQTRVGIACATGGRWGWVWAVYIALCG